MSIVMMEIVLKVNAIVGMTVILEPHYQVTECGCNYTKK